MQGDSPTGRDTRLRLVTAFVIGVASLTLEIAYTRVISFKLFYYYTYFVIGLALLGLGAASATTSVSDRLRGIPTRRLVGVGAPVAAAAGTVGYVVVARLPMDVNQIWTGSLGSAVRQVALLLLLSVSLTAVFFAVGLLFASLVVAQARDVRRLYFWDLVGAGAGCLAAVPLQATIGPPAMVAWSMIALVLLGWVASLGGRHGGRQRGRRTVVHLIAGAVVITAALGSSGLRVLADATKTLRDDDVVAAGDWGPVFRVDAVDLGDLMVLHHDGLWGSSIWRYDGTRATTARFDADNRQVPFAALGADPSVLIIGAAGGNEIMASLTYGAGHVDAVELNPVTANLLRNDFADYSGHVVDDPRVHYVQGDGRTFLARSDAQYDLIWFVAPDSYAASNAATSGAFVLSESYLYTAEMVRTAVDHLTTDGVMVAQFGDFAFDRRPTRTARYLATARSAVADLLAPFDQHVVLLADEGDNDLQKVSTIMLFRSAVDGARADAVLGALDRVPNSKPRYVPARVRLDGITSDLITLDDDAVATLVDDYPFDIGPITDDRPFFWHFSGFGSVVTDWSRSFEDNEIAIGERLLVVLVGVGAVVAAAFLWLPFALTRRRSGSVTRIAGRGRLFTYFACLGLGFMLVEVSMIQRYSLLLGFPTLSLSVSLFTLLVGTGIGARVSGRLVRLGVRQWHLLVALVSVAVIEMAVSTPLVDAALALGTGSRIAVVMALLAPIGIILGSFLPAGIDRAVAATNGDPAAEGRLVAWCWAVNGFFSVLGSSVTTIVSMEAGFDAALVAGLALYVVAVWSARRTGGSSTQAIAATTTIAASTGR